MTRIQQQVGKHGQKQAASILSGMGIEMVEEIGTPVKLLPVKFIPGFAHRKDVFRVIFGEKVSGDHRGVLPDGTSVLIETKTVLDGNLTWSHMREHQPDRLSRHAQIGRAVSLLVWVHSTGVYVMHWKRHVDKDFIGIEGFGYRKSITPERAQTLHHEFLEFMDIVIKDERM